MWPTFIYLTTLETKWYSNCLYFNANFSALEPQTGFRIAFNMFDTDGNERVDKNEFLVVSFSFTYHYLSYSCIFLYTEDVMSFAIILCNSKTTFCFIFVFI